MFSWLRPLSDFPLTVGPGQSGFRDKKCAPKGHFSVLTDQFWINTPLQLTLETFVRWFRFPVNIVFGSSDRKMQSSRLTKALWTESCRGAKATKSRIFGNCHDNFLDFCPFRDYCVEKSKKSCSCVRTSVCHEIGPGPDRDHFLEHSATNAEVWGSQN